MSIDSIARLIAVGLAVAISGCSQLGSRQQTAAFYPARDGLAPCAEFLRQADAVVAAAGVGDAMAARVPGFPHLRASRFLASHAGDALGPRALDEWIDRLARLGEEGHAVEVANLPAATQQQLDAAAHTLTAQPSARTALAHCTGLLARADKASPERIAALREAVRVPDDYKTWQRVAGLYWLTRLPFAHGVRQWHARTQAVFDRPMHLLPVDGERVRFAPPPAAPVDDVAALLARAASASPLGIPDPQGADRDALFRLFAPAFVVDVASAADRPGALVWRGGDAPVVDPRGPATVYRRISHTRFEGQVLLQLNYAIWFPERPLEAAWDLLGGHLDAVLWRVTLTPGGKPFVYDSMHHCGCYHLFFPTARARLKPQPVTLDETAFVPQRLPALDAGTPISLLLASHTHYLQRVVVGSAAGLAAREASYAFAEDDTLRSLEAGPARRSAFRPDGIVPGTERGERYLFWPMGVPEPGAMRQWGRHATAFVGRRHFDDANLFEKYFEMTDR
ncbi:hypothetical protein [Piscinibacter sakaiensis]|uniref:hypothetical protein n=1 Tax=Piscinibacter sakaiensis TaxID=1547922 RepID=UPI003AAA2498